MACALKVRAEKRKRSAGVGVRVCEMSGVRAAGLGRARGGGERGDESVGIGEGGASERMNTKLRSSVKSAEEGGMISAESEVEAGRGPW